ncbi:MAG TPA: patatin-like phospholipase family protein [Mycobacteriales bacterium]|jgi:NTE family protein|nr:patatin-like phospholipase family protein [Mycobacteriales bacterium]
MTQPDPTKRADLVLEGGGVKGIGLVGAVITLSEAGWSFPRVAGTSAGAICAALVAALQEAGKPMSDLNSIMATIDYGEFMQGDWAERHLGKAGQLGHLAIHGGMYSGDYLVEWLGQALETIGITTFGQLRMADPDSSLPPADRYRLVVHTADITRNKLVRLPWDYPEYGVTVDDTRIVDAVRASMSIPFFFMPVRFNAPAHDDGVDNFAAGEVTWVDGGLLSNFPIEVFDRSDGAPSRWPTIGVKLSAASPTPIVEHNPDDALGEAVGCVRTALDNANRFYVAPDKAQRTIFVDTFNLSATDFHLTPADQQRLFASGAAAANVYLGRA